MSPQPAIWKIKASEHMFTLDEKQLTGVSVYRISGSTFHCIKNNRSINATVMEEGNDHKKMRVMIEGETFDVEIKDALDQMLDAMGFSKATSRQVKEIKAPMPGMVLDITVQEGQAVKEGEKLLILGAMKMENSITVLTDAVIKKINVSKGQAVEKGQVLVELE